MILRINSWFTQLLFRLPFTRAENVRVGQNMHDYVRVYWSWR